MNNQTALDFSPHTRENNSGSQKVLNENKEHFKSQNELVFHLLKSGVRLTVRTAILNYGIGSLPRRLKDLEEKGIVINDRLIDGKRTKEWYI